MIKRCNFPGFVLSSLKRFGMALHVNALYVSRILFNFKPVLNLMGQITSRNRKDGIKRPIRSWYLSNDDFIIYLQNMINGAVRSQLNSKIVNTYQTISCQSFDDVI